MSSSKNNAPQQGTLFEISTHEDEVGYRVPIACQIANITYRQLDYWARTDLIRPSIRTAEGSGSRRLYSFRDILVLKIIKGLLDTGISLQNIRQAVAKLNEFGTDDLAEITLFSDGVTVYECRSDEEVVDILNGAQGVFGIAVPNLMKELTGTISAFPSEKVNTAGESTPDATIIQVDELAARRRRKKA